MGLKEINDYSFANCKNLQQLSIYGNNLIKVDKNAFSENLQLQNLGISGSQLTDLPASVFTNLGNSLAYLSLSYNKLTTLRPGWFSTLQKLEFLDLDNNEIEELPINIFSSAKNLNILSMESNKLRVISAKSFGDLSKLGYFNFRNNHIDAIDENFTNVFRFDPHTFSDTFCILSTMTYSDTPADITINKLIDCFENYRAWEAGKVIYFIKQNIFKSFNDF